jgi:hypothetical protein
LTVDHVTDAESQELQGITLDVYLYVVKKGKPVGPRDVMKGSNLSSPSVAYRHLQKLEDIGYLKKNEFGEYQIAKKGRVRGYVWLGRRLLPKMWLYSIVFAVILAIEIFVLALHFEVETYEFKVFFLLLMIITGLALTVFTVEGYLVNKRKSGLKE